MSNRSTKDVSKNILFVPLNRLKKSPKNVRKVPHTKAEIKAFAASIAAIGMLQYPVVEPETGPKGKPTGNYLVNAGEGRRLAQLLRAKRKEIKADEPIRCILDTEHNATEIASYRDESANESARNPLFSGPTAFVQQVLTQFASGQAP